MMELVPTTKMKRKLLRLEDIGGGQEDRSIRRRVDLVLGGEDSGLTVVQHQQQQKQDFSRVASSSSAASGYGFVVLLPDGSVVKLQIDGEKADPGLSVKGFVELVRRKLSLGSSSNSKLQQTPKRQIYWGSHVMIQDLSHNLLEDGAFFPLRHCEPVRTLLLQDGGPDPFYACKGLWNVTPETGVLDVLPQDYTFFSALADELDNSLQAVWELSPDKSRLICVDMDNTAGKLTIFDTGKGMDSTPERSISKWGTIGSSTSRNVLSDAIGGLPPYLKPWFGMYGFGGIGAGLHLGGKILVSSKTRASKTVAMLQIDKLSLEKEVTAGKLWQTGGGFRNPDDKELRLSPHGSFTKVEITDLNPEILNWKVDEVQRRLKDFYFPYIQNDEGGSGRTARPVTIMVNGMDLAEVLGGEVAVTNSLSGNGEPFIIEVEFTKAKERTDARQVAGEDKAHARITCHYFPITKGVEAIDSILEKLREEESGDLRENDFKTFPRVVVRRLGRLLPDARGPDARAGRMRLPFMEPRRGSRSSEAHQQCFQRVKAFIDTDAGFVPTHSKMDLLSKHAFTEALMSLGLPQGTPKSEKKGGPAAVQVHIQKEGNTLTPEGLCQEFRKWVQYSHVHFDEGATFDEEHPVICFNLPHNKKELGIQEDVFRILKTMKTRGIYMKVDDQNADPIRLKLLKGAPGLQSENQLYVTVECFVCEGLAESPGETKIICRPMDVPESQGYQLTDSDEPIFHLQKSRAFPLDILHTEKYQILDEGTWRKQEDKIYNKSPASVELLNAEEALKFETDGGLADNVVVSAGFPLPKELIAVVRPKSSCGWNVGDSTGTSKSGIICKVNQKTIVAEFMEMMLEVRFLEFHPPDMKVSRQQMETTKIIYTCKVKACTRCNIKGLYCFPTEKSILDSLFNRVGTYLFSFSLISSKYDGVPTTIVRVNVAADDKVDYWCLCSHPGDCQTSHGGQSVKTVKVRLGGLVEDFLYLSKFDKYGNRIKFLSVPNDLHLELANTEGEVLEISASVGKEGLMLMKDKSALEFTGIEVSGGNSLQIAPTYKATLRMHLSNALVATFNLNVLPGELVYATVKEHDPLHNCLRPHQIVQRFVLQAMDEYGNAVEEGQKIRLRLDGFQFQDKQGTERKADAHGCLDLGGLLKITAQYNSSCKIAVLSDLGEPLWEEEYNTLRRSLQVKNVPKEANAGDYLEGVVVEVIDENGNVDRDMHGFSHTLSLNWNPDSTVPLKLGSCTLPPIKLPYKSGTWFGMVSHTCNLELYVSLQVELNPTQALVVTPLSPSHWDGAAPQIPSPTTSSPALTSAPSFFVKREPGEDADLRVEYCRQLEVIIQQNQEHRKRLPYLHSKVSATKEELERLKEEQRKVDEEVARYEAEDPAADALSNSLILRESALHVQYTNAQLIEFLQSQGNPPGSHASSILLEAVLHNEDVGDVMGVVALMGGVEYDLLNRPLVDFLGDRMLMIVCRSEAGLRYLEGSPASGTFNEEKSLHEYAHRQNKAITGRFRSILLDEAAFYRRADGLPAYDPDDPHMLLKIDPPGPPGGPCPEGFLGYAVNLLHPSPNHLRDQVMFDRPYVLRESLYFQLFRFLQVYDTKENLMKARPYLLSGASLDGGLIFEDGSFQFCAGEEPAVRFPLVPPPFEAGEKLAGSAILAAAVATFEAKQNGVHSSVQKIKKLLQESGYEQMKAKICELEGKLSKEMAKVDVILKDLANLAAAKEDLIWKVQEKFGPGNY